MQQPIDELNRQNEERRKATIAKIRHLLAEAEADPNDFTPPVVKAYTSLLEKLGAGENQKQECEQPEQVERSHAECDRE